MSDQISRTAGNTYNYGDRAAWYAGLPTWNSPRPPSAVFVDVNRCLFPVNEEKAEREIQEIRDSFTHESLKKIVDKIKAVPPEELIASHI